MKVALQGIVALLLSASLLAFSQQTPQEPTPLCQLLSEAQANNPQIASSNDTWKAASHKVDQVTTLPDTKFTVQEFSVGSPRPFAGYTNSNFAYIAVGASQDLPFPGKLRLRGEVASRQTDALHAQVAITEATVVDAVKSDYLQLAYLQQTLAVLEESKKAVEELIQDATIHYQVGQGMQQDVLAAQIRHTDLVRRIAIHHEKVGQTEARLKELLHRDQQSPDIIAEPLSQTTLRVTAPQLLALVRAQNPQVQADRSAVTEQTTAVASAKREAKPDFGLSYMYENTDRKYRDYYMLTFDMRLPRRKRVNAEIAEAAEQLAQSRDTLDAHLQQQLAEVKQQYVRVSSDEEVLMDYSAGLITQTDATYRATLSAYSANREQFSHVVSAFVARLNLRLEYMQTLADHESAIARLETLTGASLR